MLSGAPGFAYELRKSGLRHLARLLAQLAPVAIVLVILLPGPLWIRVMGAVGGSLVGFLYSFVFLYEATEVSAIKKFPRREGLTIT